jgi:hypothetical protein
MENFDPTRASSQSSFQPSIGGRSQAALVKTKLQIIQAQKLNETQAGQQTFAGKTDTVTSIGKESLQTETTKTPNNRVHETHSHPKATNSAETRTEIAVIGPRFSNIKQSSFKTAQATQVLSNSTTRKLGDRKASRLAQNRIPERVNSEPVLQIDRRNNDGDLEVKPPSLAADKKFEKIEDQFMHKGKEIGSETIVRSDVVDKKLSSLNEKIVFLEKELNKDGITESDKSKIKTEIGKCRRDIKSCEFCKTNHREVNWIGSNHSRNCLKGEGSFLEKRENIVAAAVNNRTQTVKMGDSKEINFQRLGAVWDPRNGLVNLTDLKNHMESYNKLTKNIDRPLSHEDIHNINEHNNKLEGEISELELSKKNFSSIDQIALINETKTKLGKMKVPVENGQINAVKNAENLTEIHNWVGDRERFLREQLLEVIQSHLSTNSHLIGDDGNFPIMHLSLINEKSKYDFQESGWAHVEGNQIKDMSAIFNSLDNCTIEVGKDGPFFYEKDGKTILCLKEEDNPSLAVKAKPITLKTFYMNISVQDKNPGKDGIQGNVNKEGIDRLRKFISSLPEDKMTAIGKSKTLDGLREVERRLNNGESSFVLATKLMSVTEKAIALSEGCLSCKDRGGTVAELFAIDQITQHQLESFPSKKEEEGILENKQRLIDDILTNNKSPCIQVVNDCAGVSVNAAKVDPQKLPIGKQAKMEAYLKIGKGLANGRIVV